MARKPDPFDLDNLDSVEQSQEMVEEAVEITIPTEEELQLVNEETEYGHVLERLYAACNKFWFCIPEADGKITIGELGSCSPESFIKWANYLEPHRASVRTPNSFLSRKEREKEAYSIIEGYRRLVLPKQQQKL